MSHINELLADLLARSSEEESALTLFGPHIHASKLAAAATEEAGAAITEPWAMALEAMKEATLTCPYCSGEIGGWQPRQLPHGGCSHCAPLYAALAQMEGTDED